MKVDPFLLLDFKDPRQRVGFNYYYEISSKYKYFKKRLINIGGSEVK